LGKKEWAEFPLQKRRTNCAKKRPAATTKLVLSARRAGKENEASNNGQGRGKKNETKKKKSRFKTIREQKTGKKAATQ